MRLHRDLADAELEGHLFIQQTRDDQRHDLTFAPTEQCLTIHERPKTRSMIECGLAALERVAYRVQQYFVIEWLRQEFDSSSFHRLNRHRHVTVTRDENDRHVNPIVSNMLLQIETIQVWKMNVEN